MSAVDWLLQLDTTLLYLVNRGWAWAPADTFFLLLTNGRNWIYILVPLLILLLWKGGRKGRWAVLLYVPLVVLTDQLSSHLLKEWIARPRPCVALPDVRMIVPVLTSWSMPSSHAVNSFALTTWFGMFYPRYRYGFWVVAGLVCLSRVYLGLHYPLDVTIGAGLGILIGYVAFQLFLRLPKTWRDGRPKEAAHPNALEEISK